MLMAVAVVLWVGLLALAGEWAAQREIGSLVESMRRSLEVQALTLRGTVARYRHIPFTSGQQRDVQATLASPKNKPIDRVDIYLEDINRRVGAEALYLMDANGFTLAASNWSDAKSFKGDNYRFRPYFEQARAGGLGFFYAIGTSSGKPGLFFATPVQYGDTVLGVMAIKVTMGEVEKSWAQAESPLFLLDKRGIVFLSSRESDLYTATHLLSPQDLEELHRTKQYGTAQNGDPKVFVPTAWTLEPTDGKSYRRISMLSGGTQRSFLAIEEHLPEFDWTLMVTADVAPAQQARWTAVALGVLLSAALLFGGLFWRQRETRMRDLRRLGRALETRVTERTRDLAEADSFRTAMENSLQTGMRARDLKGRVIYVNPALCEITGYQASELMGRLPPYLLISQTN